MTSETLVVKTTRTRVLILAAIAVLAALGGAACSSVPNGPHSSIVSAVVLPSNFTLDSASFVRQGPTAATSSGCSSPSTKPEIARARIGLRC